jgi:hypothetical protein
MKISSLFDLVEDSKDILDFFEHVTTREQLVSTLERLKHQDTELLLDCLTSLNVSINRALNDTIGDLSPIVDDEEPEDDTDLEAELAKIAGSVQEEDDKKQNPSPESPDPATKDSVQS